MEKPLTPKQRAFVEHFLSCWNETEAARRAGYADPNRNAHRLMVNNGISEAIQSRLAELKMSADEVLARLTGHARGSIASFIRVSPDGEVHGFDLSDDRPLHLLHKVSITKRRVKDATEERLTLELYDAQAALALLGKHHGLFMERSEISGPGGQPIPIQAYDYNTAIAGIATRSSEGSDASGEDSGTGDGEALGQVHDGRRD